MIYLYHSVPKNLQGKILYPLNAMKEKYPDIYEQQMRKYAGREQITQQRIPVLGCLWNDVLHFSPVNPKEIRWALIEAGWSQDLAMRYYQVDPKLLVPENAVVYLNVSTFSKGKMVEENFARYNPGEVEEFSVMPQATREYYKEMIAKGELPLLHHKIPHILYKGTLDITNLPIVSV